MAKVTLLPHKVTSVPGKVTLLGGKVTLLEEGDSFSLWTTSTRQHPGAIQWLSLARNSQKLPLMVLTAGLKSVEASWSHTPTLGRSASPR